GHDLGQRHGGAIGLRARGDARLGSAGSLGTVSGAALVDPPRTRLAGRGPLVAKPLGL
ncbi:MAG: hypothetical protein AVDCRST_MAG49-643, partial [uncultured Thermomicrobiales bacterium]